MKYISFLKYAKIGIVIIIVLLVAKISVYNSYIEMKQLKSDLLKYEDDLSFVFENLSKMKEIINNLKDIKQLNRSYAKEAELSGLIKEMLCPKSLQQSDVIYDFKVNGLKAGIYLHNYTTKDVLISNKTSVYFTQVINITFSYFISGQPSNRISGATLTYDIVDLSGFSGSINEDPLSPGYYTFLVDNF